MVSSNLPAVGFLRVRQILGDKNAVPPEPPLIPVSPATWWAGVKSGRFPAPVKPFGNSITLWRVDDIRALISQSDEAAR